MNNQRGLVQRIERKLESSVDDVFARVFGGAIVGQELLSALCREAGDGVRSLPGNRLLAPNDYAVTLSAPDFENVVADPDITTDTFAKHLATYISEQGWQTYGEVVVRLQRSSDLHTGQVRARSAVNPDVSPRPTASEFAEPQSDHAFDAESGVSPMSDNSSRRGGHGQDQPGDEPYDERYGRSPDDERSGQESRGPHPPEPGPYPPEQGGYPGQPDRGQPGQGSGSGYPQPRHGDQGGYPDQGRGGYPSSYDQRPPAAFGSPPGFDPGYRQPPSGYGPRGAQPGGDQPGYGDFGGEYGGEYGRPPARHDDYGRYEGQPEQRPPYPDQGGYNPGDQSYPRADYGQPGYAQPGYAQPGQNQPGYAQPGQGQPDYGRYGQNQPGYGQPGQPGYAQPGQGQPDYGRYGEPQGSPGGYDYGQPAGGGYESAPGGYDYSAQQAGGGFDSYGQQGYPAQQAMVTLQLDDGSGRSHQLHEGSNVIGRGQDADFRLPDTGVSRRHLEIRWDGRVALLSDLNSTNGTTVNNAPVQEWQLADGDVIRLGHSEIIVRLH